jgi:hypothetical protein
MKKLFITFSLFVFICFPASGAYAKDSISGIDGETILDACKDKKSVEGQMLCSSYIASFKDTVHGKHQQTNA